MAIRGTRRRRNLDRGFVLSDHADWPALGTAITASEAAEVWVTHGYMDELVHWLRDGGRSARKLETRFEGENGAEALPAPDPATTEP
jgi:putative mRNA 3-end processing factor